jgi:hypothetical protein
MSQPTRLIQTETRLIEHNMELRFEAFTTVKMMMLFFWVLAPCRLVGRRPTFRASVLKMKTVCFFETLASTGESTRRQNPEERRHRMELLTYWGKNKWKSLERWFWGRYRHYLCLSYSSPLLPLYFSGVHVFLCSSRICVSSGPNSHLLWTQICSVSIVLSILPWTLVIEISVKSPSPVPVNPKMVLVSPSSFWSSKVPSSLRSVTECHLWKAVPFCSFEIIYSILLVSLYLFNCMCNFKSLFVSDIQIQFSSFIRVFANSKEPMTGKH